MSDEDKIPFDNDNPIDDNEININPHKKGLLIVILSIVVILVAVGIILYFVLSSNSESQQNPEPSPKPEPEPKPSPEPQPEPEEETEPEYEEETVPEHEEEREEEHEPEPEPLFLTNSIKAKYFIENPSNLTKIFQNSYLNLIDEMKVDNTNVEVNNEIIFNDEGFHTIEIYFKTNLTSLDSLFFKIETLREVDLTNLISNNIKTASDLSGAIYILFSNF